jgi:hypothetical protein
MRQGGNYYLDAMKGEFPIGVVYSFGRGARGTP